MRGVDIPPRPSRSPTPDLGTIPGHFIRQRHAERSMTAHLPHGGPPHRIATRRTQGLGASVLSLLLCLCWAHPAAAAPPDAVKVLPWARVMPWPDNTTPASTPPHTADTEARLIDVDALWLAPRIMGTPSGRRLIGPDDVVLADRDATADRFDIVRGPQALLDPSTGQVLGHQVRVIGSARRLHSAGSSALPGMRLQVVQARAEISADDRLLPALPSPATGAPRLPVSPALRAAVLTLPDDRRVAGPGEVIVLDRGQLDGLAPGHLLQAHRPDGSGASDGWEQPAHAHLLVTQTHLRVSRALVVSANDAVQPGDRVHANTPHRAQR